MTHLRKMMLEELQRRHYSEATTQRYIRFIERFAQHFHCSPDRLGPRHIREYQAQLFTVRKLTPGSVTNHLCALRFLYIQTLKRPWSIADTPYPKKRYRLPTVLSQEEVAQLIDAAPTPFYRTILMTLYGTGARRTELTRLKVSDIDSRRMVVHIQDGKGGQDRDVMLSPVLLEELRAHWRRLRKKFRLKPLLHAGEVSLTSSSINGKLVDKATGQPILGGKSIVALQQMSAGVDRVVMQTTPDPSGNFVFCPVPAGTYDVVAVAVSGAGVSYAANITTGVSPGDALGNVPMNTVTGTNTSEGPL